MVQWECESKGYFDSASVYAKRLEVDWGYALTKQRFLKASRISRPCSIKPGVHALTRDDSLDCSDSIARCFVHLYVGAVSLEGELIDPDLHNVTREGIREALASS